MSTPDRIKDAIKRTGLTQAEVARRLGVTSQSVHGWITTGKIGRDNAIALAGLAGIDARELTAANRFGIPVYATKIDEDGAEDGDVTVDVADLSLAAGDGLEQPTFVETKYRHTFRLDWLKAQGVRNPDSVKRCAVSGRSMEPVLFDGDMVTINTEDKRIVDESVYALVVGRSLKVKRLAWARDGSLLIKSDNKEWETEVVPQSELHQVHIIGRVFDRSGSGGLRK